ncbi:hypothetical protein [Silvanigrella aquatica]|uniref:Lysine transporter LysE n=1 Tax=Silvanigrella aquatica TaxID=1915309 RepID=A0A1L4CYE6_9BACT|nr:hypothetical protein [Silvanigrella aquatica]APJ02981.1 hypothetical protein AXG55_03245 [Silvanigrella aquatica]
MEVGVLIIFFMTAMLGGIVSTVPPGPLNIRLLIFFLKKEKSKLSAFQSGIILADIGCCFITNLMAQKTLQTSFFLSIEKKYLFITQILFILMLLLMGFRYIISSKAYESKSNSIPDVLSYEKKNHGKLLRHFLEGVVGTLTIPSLLPFWYLWWMGQNFAYKPPIYLVAISIALGVYFGDLLIFKTYRFFAGRVQDKMLCINVVRIEVIVGYIFLLFASALFLKIFLS